ncbi:MAG: hypothetical protein AM1032_000154 [Mycoplasmataceae bacterium]|nr:MAG: hypothetical protein AM1032_000154 [Mycoplasmataceae bacterium]
MNNELKETFIILDGINIQPLINMNNSLKEVLNRSEDTKGELYIIYQMAAVQAFEISYELCWKICKKVLHSVAIVANHSKDSFREAAKIGLIDNPELWFDFLKKRNETVHAYDSNILEEIFDILPTFVEELRKLIENLKIFDKKNNQ